MAADPYKYFRIEAAELVDELGKAVLSLEKGETSPADTVARVLRLAHTMKGAARVVKQVKIAEVAHSIESTLSDYRAGESVPRERIDLLLGMIDEIAGLTKSLVASAPGEAASRDAGKAQPLLHRQRDSEEEAHALRTDVRDLDGLLGSISEASVRVAAIRASVASLERAKRLAELVDDQLGAPQLQRAMNGSAARLRSLSGDLRAVVSGLGRGLEDEVDQVERELRQVREATERLRLLPASVTFGALERTARDAARTVGVRVAFTSSGGDVRLDAHVLTLVQSALVQCVRNAVAHGIEAEPERLGHGKNAVGLVSIAVRRRGRRVAFTCRDDGRGIDIEAVRRSAEHRGARGSTSMSRDELLALLLEGGISTSSTVTGLAGRGIGLDVVNDCARRLSAEIRLETEPGMGTSIEIVVPVSLTSFDAVVVDAAGTTVAIPIESVKHTMRLDAGGVREAVERSAVVFGSNLIPFVTMRRILDTDDGDGSLARRRETSCAVVVVEDSGSHLAIGVDRLHGAENVVLRSLPELTPAEASIAGVSLDARGDPRLVLDANGLVRAALRGTLAAGAPSKAPAVLPVLVIDDSLTTRMLEQSILESAGYAVDVATSGEEGLERARERRYGLFLVDVEMPGMDGFEFVEQTRLDPALRDTPAILVTSRGSPEDRERGRRAGACHYMVKSEFDQGALLERIRRILEG